ncbi:uncharacterized protein LOC112694989 [Athalia rosae]|uniref:uncharacterized protein LOC112694989 n=1 Tax=Athalia rosae TaxID=37344 RepID=UPI002034519F|nr:uncharacterized protein LOC112694989 [Athalia rosae]
MPAAGHPGDVDNDAETAEHLRESGPSGTPAHSEQNAPPLYHQLNHDCEGARCLCQRYENGELAAVVLNQNRNLNPPNPEREREREREREADNYQNIGRGHRLYAGRPANQNLQNHPNLNPNYQNPVDFLQNDQYAAARRAGGILDRDRRHHEPEENIYERLDEIGREYGPESPDRHTYERIDDRAWYRRARYRAGLQHASGPSGGGGDFEGGNRNVGHYESPRNVYVESRRITSPSCLSRLGRNCFSTENIASASNRRYVYQLGHNCTCQFCRHLDARTICQYCHNFHDRLRLQDATGNLATLGNSRHYIYQLSRSCRCAFCRDDSVYARFPVNSRLSDSFRRECQCRNPGSCTCRSRYLSYSNPAIYIGRIDRASHNNHAVNNPIYAHPAATYANRSERQNAASESNPSTSSNATPPGIGEPSTSSGRTSANPLGNYSASGVTVCPVNRTIDRQHVCDDSCIRNQNVNGVYQFLGRCERAECHHGRISIHWVFVNKWLPTWGAQDSVPEADSNPEMSPEEEEPRDNPENGGEES